MLARVAPFLITLWLVASAYGGEKCQLLFDESVERSFRASPSGELFLSKKKKSFSRTDLHEFRELLGTLSTSRSVSLTPRARRAIKTEYGRVSEYLEALELGIALRPRQPRHRAFGLAAFIVRNRPTALEKRASAEPCIALQLGDLLNDAEARIPVIGAPRHAELIDVVPAADQSTP
jgi:hypothetical protein